MDDPRIVDVPFEVVDEGDGYGPEHFEPSGYSSSFAPRGLASPLPPAVTQLIGRLASGLLRGHEADAVATAAIMGGFAKNPASLRATVERYEPGINAFLQEIDMGRVIDAALDPSEGYSAVDVGRASTATLIGGVVFGFVAAKIITIE